MLQTGNYSVLQKREEISKVKMLITITMFQRGFGICSMAHLKTKQNIPLPVSVLNIKHLLLFMNMPDPQTPRLFNQSS